MLERRAREASSYHPRLLLGVIVYGYATGVFSSRKLERATYDSVAFRCIAANDHPDHDTIAVFRKRFIEQIQTLFVQVLGVFVMGPVSSVFDFLTFGLLLFVFHANQALFQTGWFIESLATQVLVIFVLRTRRNPFRSRPHALLAATSIAVVVVAILLPFTPLGAWFGFVPPSAAFLLAIGGLTVGYVLLAQIAKQAFYRVWPPSVGPPAPLLRAHLPLIGRS
jgi:magnesium-transporting ATPase (P-type)